MNLIIVERHELIDDQVTLVDARAAHLLNVLNVTPGQSIRVGLLDGPLGTGIVTDSANGRVALQCRFDAAAPPIPPVDLLLALPRPKVLRRLWAQLAALGVGRIILTNAERVERNYFDTHVLAADTYRPLLIEGLQQARDTRLPQVSIHRQFRILVEDDLDSLSDAATRIVADPGAPMSIDDALDPQGGRRAVTTFAKATVVRHSFSEGGRPPRHSPRDDRVVLAIGPEGGWNDFERHLLERHRFQAVGMGSRTLRTDTACVALLTLVQQALPRR